MLPPNEALQPTAARRAFPCWDEPLLKATYGITLISRADTVNLSNMPVASEEEYTPNFQGVSDVVSWLSSKAAALTGAEKWKVTRFENTPPMSSYLVAFANGPFKYLEDSYTSPLSGKVRPLRIYSASRMEGIVQKLIYLNGSHSGPHWPGSICIGRQEECAPTLRACI